MESFVNEIIREWHTKLKELEEVKKIIKAEGLLLKDLRIEFMFIKKYFENKERIVFSKKQKNFLNLKSSSLTALNLMKEREIKKIKKAYEEIIELEKEEVDDLFKSKQEIKREKVVKRPDVGIEEKLRVIKKPKEKKVSEDKVSEEMKENKVNVLKVNEDKLVKEKVKENIVKEVKDKAVKDKVVKDDKVEDEVVRKKIVNDKVSEEKDHEDKIVKEQVSEEDKDVKEVKSIENIKPTNENELSKKPIEKHKEPIENPAKLNKIDVKNKMKSLLNAFQSKSQKNGDQNKENIPDRSILVEDGEVKLFIVNKKKRVKDFLKETKRKKNKVENEKEEIVKGKEKAKGKENVKEGEKVKEDSLPKEGNLVEELNLLKEAKPPIETHPLKEINMPTKINPPSKPNPPNETNPPINPIPPKEANLPKEMPLPKDIPSTKEIKPLKEINLSNQLKPKELPTNISNNQPKVNNPTNVFDQTSDLIKKRILKNKTPEKVYDVGTNRFISESNLKNFNLKNLCRSPLKDGLYKNIIDKERKSKSRIGMNKFIPKTPVPEINSDEEESYSGLNTEKEISEKLKNQNHEEIEKYFNSEMSVDIEMLFPNIKEISNDSPNKWG